MPKLDLIDQANLGEIQKILVSFHRATGLNANLMNLSGEVKLASGETGVGFCQLLGGDSCAAKRCRLTYLKASNHVARFSDAYFFRCWAGLVNWAVPMHAKGEYLGAIFCGRVLMWEPRDFFWSELKHALEGVKVNYHSLKSLALNLPVIDGAKVQAAAELLWTLADYITKTELKFWELQRQNKLQEAQISLEIQTRKLVERKLESLTKQARVQEQRIQEERLLKYFRVGNANNTSKVLKEIIAESFLLSGGSLGELKGRAIELVILMSRAAVECGANLENILKINGSLPQELENLETMESIHSWLQQSLVLLLEQAQTSDEVKVDQIILDITNYLQNNYDRPLTLKDIAKQVYLSPAYLSTMFKKQMGYTVMEYLNKIRIEQARKLLRRPEYNVVQVAKATGYFDPSYFTKVFKRESGISPSGFKRQIIN